MIVKVGIVYLSICALFIFTYTCANLCTHQLPLLLLIFKWRASSISPLISVGQLLSSRMATSFSTRWVTDTVHVVWHCMWVITQLSTCCHHLSLMYVQFFNITFSSSPYLVLFRCTTGQSVQMKKTVLSYATTHLGTLTHLEDCSQTLYTTFVWQQRQMGERVRALECKKAPHLEVKKLLTHSDSFTCAAIKHPVCTCYSVPTWDCQCESNCRPGHPENDDHQLFSDHLWTTEVNNTIWV